MALRDYISSKVFFGQLAIALCVIVGMVILFMYWLGFTTNHGQEISVPDLSKLSEEQAEKRLNDLDLDYVILDSVDYRKEYPKYSVVEQDPAPGSKVKVNRKVYLKINSSGFTSVKIPDLIEKTLRQAEPTLKSLGLVVGKITYKPYLGKDMVLEMNMNGKKLRIGEKVLKSSVIDLVLGDGKVGFDDAELENIPPVVEGEDNE